MDTHRICGCSLQMTPEQKLKYNVGSRGIRPLIQAGLCETLCCMYSACVVPAREGEPSHAARTGIAARRPPPHFFFMAFMAFMPFIAFMAFMAFIAFIARFIAFFMGAASSAAAAFFIARRFIAMAGKVGKCLEVSGWMASACLG